MRGIKVASLEPRLWNSRSRRVFVPLPWGVCRFPPLYGSVSSMCRIIIIIINQFMTVAILAQAMALADA